MFDFTQDEWGLLLTMHLVCFTSVSCVLRTDSFFMVAVHLDWETETWLHQLTHNSSIWYVFFLLWLQIYYLFVLQIFHFGQFPRSHHPLSSFFPHWNHINTLLSELYILTALPKKRSVLMWKCSLAVPKFAWRNNSFVVDAENQRCILNFLLLSSINLTGFLAVAAGLSEDNADLGKQPFFWCLLIEMATFQKPQLME